MKKSAGFTLIELMIVVVIASMLIAIALPSYRAYVTRSYANEAFNTLSTYHLNLEQSYQDNGNYGVGSCAVSTPTSPTFNYSCALTSGGQGYTATATANGAKGITGMTFTITDSGTRTTTAFPGASGLPVSCWLSRAGGC